MLEIYNKGGDKNTKLSRDLEDKYDHGEKTDSNNRLQKELLKNFESTKGETALKQFLELSRLYEILASWKPSDFEQIVINEESMRGQRKMDKKTRETLIEEITATKEKFSEIMEKLEKSLTLLLKSPILQNIFEAHLGRKVESFEEAKNLACGLLEPFYNIYQNNLFETEGDVQTRRGFGNAENAKDVAWAITGVSALELPKEAELEGEKKLKTE